MVDHAGLRFNQGSIVVLLLVAFFAGATWLVAFVGAVMLVGTIMPKAALFKWIYLEFVRPLGLLKPDQRKDEPQPHLFAQGLGALVLVGAVWAFAAGSALTGWLLTAVVIVLAAINLLAGFCLGCFVYYQLARRGIKLNLPMWGGA
ncbi:MAG: DUF4395 domain-containing protein [Caldilineaceae bacterium]